MKPSVLMLSPEPPYPLHGGGAYRIASLLHYFRQFADCDLALFSESGRPALIPSGLVRNQFVLHLPPHGKGIRERWMRNASRVVRGVPPLIDRLGGFGDVLRSYLAGRRYSVAIAEHFWCAPYIAELEAFADRTILDLHNIESVLHARCGAAEGGVVGLGHRWFAALSRRLEAQLLPRFGLVLIPSSEDRARGATIAPTARFAVYPNALPLADPPAVGASLSLAFPANFEYHPNIDAVSWLVREIWPAIYKTNPRVELRLIGRGIRFVKHLIRDRPGVVAIGEVEDARAEIAKSRVLIAPLRAGSGTRVKILEGWAAARPVVATTLAAEGLECRPGDDIVLADSGTALASAVDRLLSNPVEAQRMGARGRLTFERKYTWKQAWAALDEVRQVTQDMELNRYTE